MAVLQALLLLGLTIGASWLLRPKRRAPVLANERVVIFGASAGIGARLAQQYARRGARVFLVARRLQLLADVAESCKAFENCRQAEFLAADVTIETDIQKVAAAVRDTMGGCDTLVINAGIMSVLTFETLCSLDKDNQDTGASTSRTYQIMNQMFATNVFAPIIVCKHFLSSLIESKGKIVVVSSLAGSLAAPTRSLYASTKHALNGFFNSLRIEIARYGVTVTVALPGSVDTDLRGSAIDATEASNGQPSKDGSGSKLRPEACAKAIIHAADLRLREAYIPAKYRLSTLLHYFLPDLIDRMAARKYGFSM
ncbi:hypothetical protein BC832DRAFT_379956 [Gaertneriomyces semiglobifer]|nr:hypothetical protein BC832DRAFT_379956 [Gaertneriomyces semiglobifer]